jgi:Putative polyhydroxyalkanoic acid system protein (PHA_gran_rgn)
MAQLDITIEHGQPPEVARAKFQAAIREARSRFPDWIDRLDWSETGDSATFIGSGFNVRCWYDERAVHVQGTIPLAIKLLESAIRTQIKHGIHRPLPAHDRASGPDAKR